MLDFGKRLALEALDHIPMGIILCDENARVRHANDTARMIAKEGGLVLRGDHVTAEHQKENADMGMAIRKAVTSARNGNILPGEAMTLERPDGKPPLQLVISTLWGNHLRFGLGLLDEPHSILFVTDPEHPQETSAELLQRLFGLTPAEATLTKRLVTGESLGEAAESLGVSKNTSRTHLRSIFDKTGVSRQAELTKAVMSSPAWIGLKEQRQRLAP